MGSGESLDDGAALNFSEEMMELRITGDRARAVRAIITYARNSDASFSVHPWKSGPVVVSGEVSDLLPVLQRLPGVTVDAVEGS